MADGKCHLRKIINILISVLLSYHYKFVQILCLDSTYCSWTLFPANPELGTYPYSGHCDCMDISMHGFD